MMTLEYETGKEYGHIGKGNYSSRVLIRQSEVNRVIGRPRCRGE